MRIAFGFDVPPQQAINYFRAKGLKQTFSYDEMMRGEHAQALTIAKMLDNDLLQDVYDSLLQAMVSGESMQDWKKRLIPHLQANGWWGKQEMVDPATGKTISAQLGSVRRLELIFRTNMQSAYAAGQWQQIQANKATMPYLQYNAVDDLRTRDEHRALDNKVYPVDHPFWRYYYPPNSWNCRCSVIQLSQKMLDDAGLSVSPDEDVEYKNWKNPRTGETVKLPKGIDPGFQFNAGIQRAEHLQELAREKARAIRDAELRDAAENGLALVERAVKGEKGIAPPKAAVEPAMTEKIINNLLSDTNKDRPLTEINARTMLTLAPEGYRPKTVAGAGGEGADLVFANSNGDLFKIENKSTASYASFKGHLVRAAKQQATGSLVFIQVPDGTDVSKWMARFWGSRKHIINSVDTEHVNAMSAYKTTKLVIYSASGVLLLESQYIYNPSGE